MTPLTRESTTKALTRLLLGSITPAMAAETQAITNIDKRIAECIERVKAQTSEGAALVADCAPHGRAMLTEAQQRHANLQALELLAELASEVYGT